ncbi:MAG: MFS transporter [Erysipelotrichaceae bacterium]|nr:MFS transporter [Erysipelotrichaceae bacterium]
MKINIFSQYRGLQKEIYVLFVCKLIDNAGLLVGPMFTLILSNKMGMSGTEIALYLSLFSILCVPVQLLGGRLGDKVNKKLIINICDITTSLVYIFCGIVGLNKVTLFVYMLGSLLQNAESPIYDSMIADFTTSADRERAYSLNYVGLNLGLALAPTIAGFMLKDYLWLMFVISGVSELISIIVFNIYIKDVKAIVDETNVYEKKMEEGNALSIFKENKILILMLIIFSLGTIAYNMYAYLMPLTLADVHGDLGSIYYGTISSINCIVVFTCTALLTNILERFISIDKMMIAEGCELVGYLLFMLFVGKQFMYYPMIIIFTVGEIINTIAITPYITRRIPLNYRTRISSFISVVATVIGSFGIYAIGKIYDNYGYNLAWIVTIVIIVLIIVLYSCVKKMDKKTYPELYKNNLA